MDEMVNIEVAAMVQESMTSGRGVDHPDFNPSRWADSMERGANRYPGGEGLALAIAKRLREIAADRRGRLGF
jgi:hypothetical protein